MRTWAKLFIFIIAPGLVLGSCATISPPLFRQIGTASWYSRGFVGKTTACGDIYDPREMTAAHRHLPCGTRVRVIELRSGKEVGVTITDRGPYVAGRILDLSLAAARRLGIARDGTARVEILLAEN